MGDEAPVKQARGGGGYFTDADGRLPSCAVWAGLCLKCVHSLRVYDRQAARGHRASASSQLGLIRELEVAVIGRRTELESCAVPVVVAVRPPVGEAHPRDEPPPPPLTMMEL